VLTPAGEAELDVVDQRGFDEQSESRGRAELLTPPGSSPEFQTLLRRSNPGQVRVDSPILLIHGTADLPGVQALHDRMCQRGQNVELRYVDRRPRRRADAALSTASYDLDPTTPRRRRAGDHLG
jgi:hypothetical protein